MAAPKKTFEKRLTELESIVQRMEEGQLPLEDNLKLYEQGVRLHQTLAADLDTAEKRMLELTHDGLREMEDAP